MRRNIRDTLARAVEHHRAGRLEQAEALYRKVIKVQPNEADALHLLGMLAHKRGQFNEAENLVRQAIAARGRPVAEFSNTLGNALLAQGRSDEAIASFREAMALHPKDASACRNLANALNVAGRHVEACAQYDTVLQLTPDDAGVHNDLGGVFLSRGMYQEATECFGRAIKLDPQCAEAYSNLGHSLRELGRLTEALNCLEAAIRLRPSFGAAYANLSCVVHQLGSHADAIRCVQTALQFDPANAFAHSNYGNLLKEELRLDEAIACYDKALELRPTFHEARLNRTLTRFMAGQIQRGWEEYECRWAAQKLNIQRPLSQPRWDGGPLTGKKLIFWGEQGLGDEMIFAGMIPEVVAEAARCIVECEVRLVPLFARSFPGATVVPRTLPPHPATAGADLQIPAGTAGRWLRPSLDRFPRGFPRDKGYLRADSERVAFWRARLDAIGDGLKVGICWRSGLTAGLRTLDCTELREWGAVLGVPGVHFINLQYDDCRAELGDAYNRLGVTVHGWSDIDLKQDIDEVAALVTAVDLVVSVGTSVACLAGALGRPVWQLTLTSSGDCWTMGQAYVPWFPSTRLYERAWDRKWEVALARVALDLAHEVRLLQESEEVGDEKKAGTEPAFTDCERVQPV